MVRAVEKAGGYQVLTFEGMVMFASGFINATNTINSRSLQICQDRIIASWSLNIDKIVNTTTTPPIDYFKVAWAVLDMSYNVDPITRSCYFMSMEFYLGMLAYWNALTPTLVI